jgi:hypothetical protein
MLVQSGLVLPGFIENENTWPLWFDMQCILQTPCFCYRRIDQCCQCVQQLGFLARFGLDGGDEVNGGVARVDGVHDWALVKDVMNGAEGNTLDFFADYVVPVNADVPEIITIDVALPDLQASALGGKAVGELGIVGVAAAIGNAVYHATGKRIRDLPFTMDKLLT